MILDAIVILTAISVCLNGYAWRQSKRLYRLIKLDQARNEHPAGRDR